MRLRADNITYQVGCKCIVRNCSLEIRPGFFTAVAGPNGAGKTSLLKILSGEQTRHTGCVHLNGKIIRKIKAKELSTLRAVLTQYTSVNFPFTIEQIVAIGRHSHHTTNAQNAAILDEVMELTNLSSFRGRAYQSLSGGEQQRVHMARVMAQVWDETPSPKYLLLDEPTSSLDLAQQHALLSLAAGLCQRGIGVLAILHDLNLTSQYADEVLFLKEGETIAYGTLRQVMTRRVIEETYSHPVEVTHDEWTGRPRVYALTSEQSLNQKQLKQYTYESVDHG